MKEVIELIEARRLSAAADRLYRWHKEEPMNLLTFVALGRLSLAQGDRQRAARAWGSIIDFHPSRADMRRFAAAWLASLGTEADALLIDILTAISSKK